MSETVGAGRTTPSEDPLPPALARMVQLHREIATGQRAAPAELWIATATAR